MTVRAQRLVDGPVLPLLVRALLLLLCSVALLLAAGREYGPERGAELAERPALVLLVVIAVGALPLPGRTARVLQAYAEVMVLGLVVGSIPVYGGSYAPLLLVPVFSAGLRGGLPTGAGSGVVAGVSWVLGLATAPLADFTGRLGEVGVWTVILVATGLIGGWVRRLSRQDLTSSDGAYEDAFFLLSELQELTRNLSLGLDPATLGGALLDDVARIHPQGRRTVVVRTSDGRFAPLVAAGPLPAGDTDGDADEAAPSAWSSGRRASVVVRAGQVREAFPVRMGSDVVAVVTVCSTQLSGAELAALERLVSTAGPRLAAALTFDEVRQLATVDERLRLAREIHDGVAQELASVGYMLDDVADRVPADAAEELHSLREHVRGVLGELRMSIFDLRTGVDDKIGLGTALSEHVQRVGQHSDLVVHTVLDEHGDRLPAGVEVELLRIAQEAVINVRRHAEADNLWVECTVDAPRVWLRIADDGRGLQPPRAQSMGIRGMQERARRIGGDLQVLPRPGGGTVVEVSVGEWDEGTRGR